MKTISYPVQKTECTTAHCAEKKWLLPQNSKWDTFIKTTTTTVVPIKTQETSLKMGWKEGERQRMGEACLLDGRACAFKWDCLKLFINNIWYLHNNFRCELHFLSYSILYFIKGIWTSILVSLPTNVQWQLCPILGNISDLHHTKILYRLKLSFPKW